MESLAWSEQYVLNIRSMDEEHRELFVLFNKVILAYQEGVAQEEIFAAFSAYVDEVERHFASEEGLLEKYGYPGYQKQKKDHASYGKRLREYQNRLSNAQFSISEKLLMELGQWKIGHVLGADAAYAEFLLEQGVR